MRVTPIVFSASLLLGAGCDFQFNLAVNSTAEVLKRGSKSLDREPDVQLAHDALPATIKTIDTFSTAAPEQPVLLELTAKAYAQYAFAFLEDDLEELPPGDSPARKNLVDRATGLYDRAFDIGLRMAELDRKGIRDAIKKDIPSLEAELKKLGPDAGVGLFWAGLSMASAINLHRDDTDRLADLPKAILLLTRAHELVPEYADHGAALGLGASYSGVAKAVGGDPEKSKAMFEECVKANDGKYLMAKVFYARFYAVINQDRPLFDRLLKEVLDTPANVYPDQRLANELAHRRAARYQRQAEDLF